jgi:hypothetical protein
MLEFTVVAAFADGPEGQEHVGDFSSLAKAKSFAKDIVNDADVDYSLVYNIDQELIAEYFSD